MLAIAGWSCSSSAGRHRASARLSRVAVVALLAAAVLVPAGAALLGPKAGRAATRPDCGTPTSPLAGAQISTMYNSRGLLIRRFTKAGMSPVFVGYADPHHTSVFPLLNSAVIQRRQVRDMIGSAIGAVNGDFFNATGGSEGVEVARGGSVVKGVTGTSAAVVSDSAGRLTIGQVTTTVTLRAKISATATSAVPAHVYNTVQRAANSIAVYDGRWGTPTSLRSFRWPAQPAVSYIVASGHVAKIVPGVTDHAFPSNGFIVVAQGAGITALAQAGWRTTAAVSLGVTAVTGSGARPYGAIGAGELIAGGGQVLDNACGYDAPTPRTAVGVQAGTGSVLLVAASGKGLSMRALNALMQSLRVVDAAIMDGGGSTVMVERGTKTVQLTVHPYRDEGDRPVPNGLGVFPR